MPGARILDRLAQVESMYLVVRAASRYPNGPVWWLNASISQIFGPMLRPGRRVFHNLQIGLGVPQRHANDRLHFTARVSSDDILLDPPLDRVIPSLVLPGETS